MLSTRASQWASRCTGRRSLRVATEITLSYRQSLSPFFFWTEARRCGSSASSRRWQTRQAGDKLTKEAKIQGLMSRAAFKLLEMNEKHRIFRKGQTVVDLGFAPGSWSQVAADRTAPKGRVIGIDIIPAQPPKGVSTIQGNFLSEGVREEVKRFLRDPEQGRLKEQKNPASSSDDDAITEKELDVAASKLFSSSLHEVDAEEEDADEAEALASPEDMQRKEDRLVDVVLSDMCAPWAPLEPAYGKHSLNDPYYRMMNTSGISFRDHAGSMDLCNAALIFAFDTLKPGGSFVCKFYQGAEDKAFEKRLKTLFTKVHRDKPSSSRSESKEAYFVATKRKKEISRGEVFG